MKKILSVILSLILLAASLFTFSSCDNVRLQKFKTHYFDYFDTVTTIIGWEETQEDFDAICNEIKHKFDFYHKLYNIYNTYDGVNNICTINKTQNGAHKEVEVDPAVTELLLYCKEMYVKTDGKLNVALGSVLSLWHQHRTVGMNDPAKATLPDTQKLKEKANHCDINKLIIDAEKNTVFIDDPYMTLDVGAVAKGFSVEKVAEYLTAKGVTGYVLNVGGNVRTIGNSQGDPWKVGIDNPDAKSEEDYIEILNLENKSLVTSGNYQRYYVVNGENYHHIIDPETLMPGDKYTSVSVVTTHSGYADVMSTTLFLTDFEEGLAFVENTEDLEVMWVMPDGQVKYSSGFKKYVSQ